MNKVERETVRRKANGIRTRNNQIERLVSSLHGPRQDGDSVLLRELSPEMHRARWEEVMQLLADQFGEIQELIGMVKD